MLDILKFIILLPFYILGYIAGFCYRPMVRGFFVGWFSVELKEGEKLTGELEEELERIENEQV